jgi:hypothetical protein
MVILAFFPGNDIRENSAELTRRFNDWVYKIYFTRVIPARIQFLDRWIIFPWSYLNQFVVNRASDYYINNLYRYDPTLSRQDLMNPELGVYGKYNRDPLWEKAWQITQEKVIGLRNLAQDNDIEFLMFILDSFQIVGQNQEEVEMNKNLDLNQPTNRILKFCTDEGIHVVSMHSKKDNFMKKGERCNYPYDGHWNPTGHKVAAEILFSELTNLPQIKNFSTQ